MAKERKDKLHDHAVEHLQGGQNAEPNPMLKAACTVGEATNDRIERGSNQRSDREYVWNVGQVHIDFVTVINDGCYFTTFNSNITDNVNRIKQILLIS